MIAYQKRGEDQTQEHILMDGKEIFQYKMTTLSLISIGGIVQHIFFLLENSDNGQLTMLLGAGIISTIVVQIIIFAAYFSYFKDLFHDEKPESLTESNLQFLSFTILVYCVLVSITFLNQLGTLKVVLTPSHVSFQMIILFLYFMLFWKIDQMEAKYKFAISILSSIILMIFINDYQLSWSVIRTLVAVGLILLYGVMIKHFMDLAKQKLKGKRVDVPAELIISIGESRLPNQVYRSSYNNVINPQKNSMQKNVESYEENQGIIQQFTDQLRTGVILLNEKCEIVLSNQAAETILSRSSSTNFIQNLISNTKVYWIDDESYSIIYGDRDRLQKQLESIQIEFQNNNASSIKESSIMTSNKVSSSIGQSQSNSNEVMGVSSRLGLKSKGKIINKVMKEFIDDIFSNKTKIVGQQIQILRYVSLIHDFQIKIEVFEHGGVYQVLFLLEHVKQRDDFLRKKFSYKIMKKLFRSFSHEFGTSLNCVMTVAQTASANQQISERLQNIYINPILKSAKILNSIVNDIRDYNHMLGGTFNLTYQEVHVMDVVLDVVELFREQIQVKGIEVIVESEDNTYPETIISDPFRIKQVLQNLIGNASKFTFDGFIRVKVGYKEVETDKFLTIEVFDSGIGMTQSQKKRLEEFLKTGISQHGISQNTTGFGMGLYISNYISKNLSKNEGLKFNSQSGHGSNFSFDIQIINIQERLKSESQKSFGHYIVLDNNQIYDSNLGSSFFGVDIGLTASAMIQARKRMVNHQDTWGPLKEIKSSFYLEKSKWKHETQSRLVLQNDEESIQRLINIDKQIENTENAAVARNNPLKRTPTILDPVMEVDDEFPKNGSRQSKFNKQEDEEMGSVNEKLNSNRTQNIDLPQFPVNQNITSFRGQMSKENDNLIERRIENEATMKLSPLCQNCPPVLVVDDQAFNIMGLELMLEMLQIRCDSAYNGEQCIDKVQLRNNNDCQCGLKTYQLIFMDINMPKKDGYQTTKELQQLIKENKILPVMIAACTAFVDIQTKHMCFQFGMDHFMNQPVSLDSLEEVLRQYNVQFSLAQ